MELSKMRHPIYYFKLNPRYRIRLKISSLQRNFYMSHESRSDFMSFDAMMDMENPSTQCFLGDVGRPNDLK